MSPEVAGFHHQIILFRLDTNRLPVEFSAVQFVTFVAVVVKLRTVPPDFEVTVSGKAQDCM